MDIVEELRKAPGPDGECDYWTRELISRAADEIERLRSLAGPSTAILKALYGA